MLKPVLFLTSAVLTLCPCHADPIVVEDGAPATDTQLTLQAIEVNSLRVREGQRLLVDLRAALEALGWTVEWAPTEQAILARKDEARLLIKVNSPVVRINDRELKLPGPARMLWHRVYVPVGLLAEVMRARAEYLGDAVRLTPIEGAALVIHLLG